MLAVCFEFCTLDDLPVDQSKAYQQLVKLCGKEIADQFVEERECNIHPQYRGDANGRPP